MNDNLTLKEIRDHFTKRGPTQNVNFRCGQTCAIRLDQFIARVVHFDYSHSDACYTAWKCHEVITDFKDVYKKGTQMPDEDEEKGTNFTHRSSDELVYLRHLCTFDDLNCAG